MKNIIETMNIQTAVSVQTFLYFFLRKMPFQVVHTFFFDKFFRKLVRHARLINLKGFENGKRFYNSEKTPMKHQVYVHIPNQLLFMIVFVE